MSSVSFNANVTRPDQRVEITGARREDDQSVRLEMSYPSGADRWARKILNFFSFGSYTKHVDNPRQWRTFERAVRADPAFQGDEARQKIDTAFQTYSQNKRLTQGKVSNILADLKSDRPLKARVPQRLNASQNFLARAFRSLGQLCRRLTETEQEIRGNFPDPQANAKARAVHDILRPGKELLSSSMDAGRDALRELHGRREDVVFSHAFDGYNNHDVGEFLTNTRTNGAETIEQLKQQAEQGKRSLLLMPFGLQDGARVMKEDHSVLIAVDFNNKKVLFLDSKSESLNEVEKEFTNAPNLRQDLKDFGRAMFGEDWSDDTGVQTLALAKQQGANDCGAFTHDFSRRLIEGDSVGDIERSFTAEDRAAVRMRMANDISASRHVQEAPQLPPLISGRVEQGANDPLMGGADDDF